jgi:hypothetical protein
MATVRSLVGDSANQKRSRACEVRHKTRTYLSTLGGSFTAHRHLDQTTQPRHRSTLIATLAEYNSTVCYASRAHFGSDRASLLPSAAACAAATVILVVHLRRQLHSDINFAKGYVLICKVAIHLHPIFNRTYLLDPD